MTSKKNYLIRKNTVCIHIKMQKSKSEATSERKKSEEQPPRINMP